MLIIIRKTIYLIMELWGCIGEFVDIKMLMAI